MSVALSGLGFSSHVIPARIRAAAWDLWLRHHIVTTSLMSCGPYGTGFEAVKIEKKLVFKEKKVKKTKKSAETSADFLSIVLN